ncbi:MAG: hypoxanthine phosphoribosyltransferase [Promethearchaeota archaeon]|nr:MAG: hypoxanthine phosphoribosyltransferase [Candidatus Lokiarchaeota archaeon]
MHSIPNLELYISKKKIEATVLELADQINKDYGEKKIVVIGILKGAFIFMADLLRHLDLDVEVDFIRLSSYGKNIESCGMVEIGDCSIENIKGRHILIVEDIIDTGLTINALIKYLRSKSPASIKLCTFLDKPSRREVPVEIDYAGIEVPNRFIVGYGMDYNEKYRHLADIFFFKK